MNKILYCTAIIGAVSAMQVYAQDLSVDEAIEKISSTAKEVILSGYRANDETGDFQFVDAEIRSIHDFNDYSFGAMLEVFESVLDRRLKLATSDAPSSMWPEERKAVIKENPRLLEYAKANMTRIVGYSAIVDYTGITKFREKKDISTLLFFDSKGDFIDVGDTQLKSLLLQIIGAESTDYVTDRDNVKKRLAPVMFQQIVSELRKINDPLFLTKEYWISELVSDSNGNKQFDMQWCYRLTKENIGNDDLDKGHFRAYYYQIQTGLLQTIKMILVLDGTYEKDKSHIWFSYDSADVNSYHITYDATASFEPGDYKSIDYRICTPQLLESRRVKRIIQAENNTPSSYEWLDENTFKMVAPVIKEEPCTFTRSF